MAARPTKAISCGAVSHRHPSLCSALAIGVADLALVCMSYRKASKAAKKDKRRAKREDRRAEKEAIKRPAVDDQGHCRCWECLVTYPGLRTHNRSGL